MSLHMFKKLRRIHGQQLWKNLYALVVFENQNLRQLFNVDEEHKIEILRGKISFQNNRMLCYDKVYFKFYFWKNKGHKIGVDL